MHVGSAELGTRHSQEKIHGAASQELCAIFKIISKMKASSQQELNILDRRIRLIEGKAKCHHLKNLHITGLCGRCLSVGERQ
jgi:hypothetical protein